MKEEAGSIIAYPSSFLLEVCQAGAARARAWPVFSS
jgi:hypothetical protein